MEMWEQSLEVKMQGEQMISALIGLVGAVSNNGRTEQTDRVIHRAFLQMRKGGSEQEMVEEIHREKYAISPDCAVCRNPCGNTSDYDMARFHEASESIQNRKLELIKSIGDYLESVQEEKLPDLIYQGIAYLGYDLEENAYTKLIEQIRINTHEDNKVMQHAAEKNDQTGTGREQGK